MSKRENKAGAAEFRALVDAHFEEFTHHASVKRLLAIGKCAGATDTAVWQFAATNHPLFQQQRARLERVVRAWQLGGAEHPPQIAEVFSTCAEASKGRRYHSH